MGGSYQVFILTSHNTRIVCSSKFWILFLIFVQYSSKCSAHMSTLPPIPEIFNTFLTRNKLVGLLLQVLLSSHNISGLDKFPLCNGAWVMVWFLTCLPTGLCCFCVAKPSSTFYCRDCAPSLACIVWERRQFCSVPSTTATASACLTCHRKWHW
jgi:hypothetical protein